MFVFVRQVLLHALPDVLRALEALQPVRVEAGVGEAGLGSGMALTVSLLGPGTGGGDMLVVVRDTLLTTERHYFPFSDICLS